MAEEGLMVSSENEMVLLPFPDGSPLWPYNFSNKDCNSLINPISISA